VFEALATRIVTDLAPPPGAAGCTARLLDALEDAATTDGAIRQR
jgi:hypothetical protein